MEGPAAEVGGVNGKGLTANNNQQEIEHAYKDTDPRFGHEDIASTLARVTRTGRHATGPDRQARVEPGTLANHGPVRG